jgi:hypothetical protein
MAGSKRRSRAGCTGWAGGRPTPPTWPTWPTWPTLPGQRTCSSVRGRCVPPVPPAAPQTPCSPSAPRSVTAPPRSPAGAAWSGRHPRRNGCLGVCVGGWRGKRGEGGGGARGMREGPKLLTQHGHLEEDCPPTQLQQARFEPTTAQLPRSPPQPPTPGIVRLVSATLVATTTKRWPGGVGRNTRACAAGGSIAYSGRTWRGPGPSLASPAACPSPPLRSARRAQAWR